MADALLRWNDFGADIDLSSGDLAVDEGLATAVLISIFTDARAPDASLLPSGETSLRGYWGDFDEDQSTGSLMWLIQREKTTSEVARRAFEYCTEALEWVKSYDIAETVTVDSRIVGSFGLQIKIKISRGNAKGYSYLWYAIAKYTEQTIQNTTFKIELLP